jgi:hypothetical protein
MIKMIASDMKNMNKMAIIIHVGPAFVLNIDRVRDAVTCTIVYV